MEGFEGFNVREWLGTIDAPKTKPSMIRKRDWDAGLAYERLKTVRKVEDMLSEGINKQSIEIPEAIADRYEKVWAELKAIERMEVETIRWGR